MDEEFESPANNFQKPWETPPVTWIKCNLGLSWSNHTKIAGCSWVVRDNNGLVIIHSRRSFANLQSRHEAFLHCLLWGINSMISHRLDRIIFAMEDTQWMKVMERPKV